MSIKGITDTSTMGLKFKTDDSQNTNYVSTTDSNINDGLRIEFWKTHSW